MIIRKEKNGNYYVCRNKQKVFIEEKKGIYLIKADTYSGKVGINSITFPLDWVGKRIRLRIEVVKDGRTNTNGVDGEIQAEKG